MYSSFLISDIKSDFTICFSYEINHKKQKNNSDLFPGAAHFLEYAAPSIINTLYKHR